MNIVVGNSIKIETSLDMATEVFKAHYFNSTHWPEFLFSSQTGPMQASGISFNSFEHLGNNRLILEDDEIMVDTIITKSSANKTELQIVVDIYWDDFDLNSMVNNIIDNSDAINNKR